MSHRFKLQNTIGKLFLLVIFLETVIKFPSCTGDKIKRASGWVWDKSTKETSSAPGKIEPREGIHVFHKNLSLRVFIKTFSKKTYVT